MGNFYWRRGSGPNVFPHVMAHVRPHVLTAGGGPSYDADAEAWTWEQCRNRRRGPYVIQGQRSIVEEYFGEW